MRPLVVVDLESLTMPEFAKVLVASTHKETAPNRPLVVVGHEDPIPEAAGIIVTGSDQMLHDDTPWAAGLCQRLEEAAKRGTPVFAICFGHQMLCWHYGGTVERWEETRQGVAPVQFQGDGPFQGLDEVNIFHTHRDHVTHPGTLQVVAEGGLGGIQATRHPKLPIWTVQGHPEAKPEFVDALPPERRAHLPPDFDPQTFATPDGKLLLEGFGRLLRD